jgi:hypothetical protein
MSCPYFKEGYFGICVAPDAIHVPSIAEMEKFCFRARYESCPSFTHMEYSMYPEKADHVRKNGDIFRH